MKFTVRGVTLARVKGRPRRELHRELALNQELLEQVPRLQRAGDVQFGGLGTMAAQGWTAEEVNRVVDAFPDADYRSLTLLVSLAGALRGNGVPDVQDVIAWLRAIADVTPDGQFATRPVVREEVARARRGDAGAGIAAVPALWTAAAGSAQAGLAALRAGLTLAETAARNGT